jgi:hypothetical protein
MLFPPARGKECFSQRPVQTWICERLGHEDSLYPNSECIAKIHIMGYYIGEGGELSAPKLNIDK